LAYIFSILLMLGIQSVSFDQTSIPLYSG